MSVQRVEFQVHWTGQRQRDTDTVEDRAEGEYPDVDVRHDDVVEVSLLLVGEEQIRHPHSVCLGQRQVFQFAWRREDAETKNETTSWCKVNRSGCGFN